jgi:hypothetical protein
LIYCLSKIYFKFFFINSLNKDFSFLSRSSKGLVVKTNLPNTKRDKTSTCSGFQSGVAAGLLGTGGSGRACGCSGRAGSCGCGSLDSGRGGSRVVPGAVNQIGPVTLGLSVVPQRSYLALELRADLVVAAPVQVAVLGVCVEAVLVVGAVIGADEHLVVVDFLGRGDALKGGSRLCGRFCYSFGHAQSHSYLILSNFT